MNKKEKGTVFFWRVSSPFLEFMSSVFKFSSFLFALSLLPLAGCAPAGRAAKAPPPGIQAPRVLLVSWDGAKPSVMKALLDAGELPNLKSLMDGGSWTLDARVVGPTVTLPSHTTMVTGLPASEHAITWNTHMPERGPVAAETLFDLCREAGLKSAMVYGKEKFKHLVRPGSPDETAFVGGDAAQVAEAGERFLRRGSFALVMVHFAQPDAAGHDFGWGNEAKSVPPSKEYAHALAACDTGLGRLLGAVRETGGGRALVIVTADHGGHDKTHGTDSEEDVLIPWVAGGASAAHLGELVPIVRSTDTAPTVLESLGLTIPVAMVGKPVACLRVPLRKAA
jgi:predicted AlkP superfamily pyrophosphatase or phosphodiesterase